MANDCREQSLIPYCVPGDKILLNTFLVFLYNYLQYNYYIKALMCLSIYDMIRMKKIDSTFICFLVKK